ncbi:hypothetical protein C0992_010110 [Termitomyces sp. T32_za158]|nr:hypothetical protein C0992_010110 [Termitomyces sp. T32_za158]
MSQGMPNNSDLVNFRVVSEEEYRTNVKRAEEAQAQLDRFKAMNEAAKQAYDKQQELLSKIQEGKEAETLALGGSSGQKNPPTVQGWHPASDPYMQSVVVNYFHQEPA